MLFPPNFQVTLIVPNVPGIGVADLIYKKTQKIKCKYKLKSKNEVIMFMNEEIFICKQINLLATTTII